MSSPINIITPLIGIETSILKQNDNSKFALFLYPTIPFSHNNIPQNIINVFIALDISGSMNVDVPNINNNETTDSRYTCSVKSLRPLLELFRKLSSFDKKIHLWLYTFNSNVYPIVENYTIENNDECINNVISKCENIYPRFGTDIGSVIKRIAREQTYLRIDDNIKTISLLLSDGFSNGGLTSEQLISLYPNFFDATIGIGEDDDYDFKLLTAISKENRVRGCMTSDDIYDQLIDAIFSDLEIYSDTLIINVPNDIKLLDSNHKYEIDTHTKIYLNKLRHSQPIILVFNGCPHSLHLQFEGVKNNKLEDISYIAKYNNNDMMDISFIKLDNNTYDLDINLTDDGTNIYDKTLIIDIGEYNILSNYLNIIRDFNSFDIDSITSIKNVKTKIDNAIDNLLNKNSRSINMINTILNQFKKRVDTLYQNNTMNILDDELPDQIPHYTNDSKHNLFLTPNNKRIKLTTNNNTPLSPSQSVASVRIMRRQNGNYASLSSNLSQQYSQSNDNHN
jgi:hypothetical protein